MPRNIPPNRSLVGAMSREGILTCMEVEGAIDGDAFFVFLEGCLGPHLHAGAAAHGIMLEVVKLASAKRGFVLLLRRWVIERSFAWLARFRRLSRDYKRLSTTLAGMHWLAFACLLLVKLFRINPQS